jgi:hypothetical protein
LTADFVSGDFTADFAAGFLSGVLTALLDFVDGGGLVVALFDVSAVGRNARAPARRADFDDSLPAARTFLSVFLEVRLGAFVDRRAVLLDCVLIPVI